MKHTGTQTFQNLKVPLVGQNEDGRVSAVIAENWPLKLLKSVLSRYSILGHNILHLYELMFIKIKYYGQTLHKLRKKVRFQFFPIHLNHCN